MKCTRKFSNRNPWTNSIFLENIKHDLSRQFKMKKYQQRHGNILGIKQAIAFTTTLKFIGVLKTEMTKQTNQLSRVMSPSH